MRKAFTLIEVNLAMLIMAVGILTVCGLYAFGYRENRQSREDVAATALADVVVSQLMAAITATNLSWTTFNSLENYPSDDGWGDYFNSEGIVTQDPQNKAESVFGSVMSKLSKDLPGTFDTSTKNLKAATTAAGMSCGLVVSHEKGSPIVSVAFRATKQPGTLLAMPLYYCEGRFQGDPTK